MQLRLELLVNGGQLYLDYCLNFPPLLQSYQSMFVNTNKINNAFSVVYIKIKTG